MKFKPFQGPAEQTFVDPDSGFKYSAGSRADLLKYILNYRNQNGYPVLDALNATIDNYQCKLPENDGKCEQNVYLKRGLMETIKGGISILVNVAYDKIAPKEEADRRSEICKDCKYNIHPEKGLVDTWADMIAIHMVGHGNKSKHHEELGNCEVCSCPLKGKVFYAGTVELTPEQTEAMKEVGCWQLGIVK